MKMKCNFDQIQKQNLETDGDLFNAIRRITETISPEETFYILNVEDVLLKFNNWKKELPGITPYYAVKCNPNPTLLRILSALGVCFDCASKNEIKLVLSLGVHSSRIIFANPARLSSHLKYAAEQKVNTITVDGEEELYQIKRLHPTSKVLLRIRSDATSCMATLGLKFGCDSITEAPDLLRLARKLKLRIVGICFHVGTGCFEPTAYGRAIGKVRSLFTLGMSLGFRMRVLDIGGGFPGHTNSSINEIAKNIRDGLKEYFPKRNEIDIIAEPGRYFVTSAFSIATYIHGKRVIRDDDTGEPINLFFIPDGIFGSFNALVFDPPTTFHPIPLSQSSKNCKMMKTFICGPTNHPSDVITEKINFPDSQVGDWMLFENMGAYRAASARYFSGFTLPEVYAVYNGSILLPSNSFQSEGDEYHFVVKKDSQNARQLLFNIIYPGNGSSKENP